MAEGWDGASLAPYRHECRTPSRPKGKQKLRLGSPRALLCAGRIRRLHIRAECTRITAVSTPLQRVLKQRQPPHSFRPRIGRRPSMFPVLTQEECKDG